MIELKGEISYQIEEDTNISYIKQKKTISKELLVYFPHEKGISVLEDGGLYLTNTYLAEKTLKEIFYGIDLTINFGEIYYYEIERDLLIKVSIELKTEKDIKKFLRKNKIAHMLYES